MSRRGRRNPHKAKQGLTLWLCGLPAALVGCSGVQSALEPAGEHASDQAQLFWWMTAGSVLIWLIVMGLTWYAVSTPERSSLTGARRLIVIGGLIVPSVLLTALLCHGLALLPQFLAAPAAGSLEIQVRGEQWWWRVRYLPDGRAPIELANEIRLPVGEPVEFELESLDVIHSFWIPSLGGKVDMIPGRRTRLMLKPTRTGTFRGACAEYCGASHAFMNFSVVVQEREAFDDWLARQARPARHPTQALPSRGHEVLIANGCGACHTLRGTAADGVIGPDLTHVGSRLSLAAGLLENERLDFVRWIGGTKSVKPEAHMPAFGMLPADDLQALGAYLEALE
jgi:cytochrome c oxidase subunit 2